MTVKFLFADDGNVQITRREAQLFSIPPLLIFINGLHWLEGDKSMCEKQTKQ